MYLSLDIDVLDPAFAPGTGTPEAGGLTSRELLSVLRGLTGLHLVVGDVVEVARYNHAEITAIAAATVLYCLLTLLGPPPLTCLVSRSAAALYTPWSQPTVVFRDR